MKSWLEKVGSVRQVNGNNRQWPNSGCRVFCSFNFVELKKRWIHNSVNVKVKEEMRLLIR